jgi:hypothetical protein
MIAVTIFLQMMMSPGSLIGVDVVGARHLIDVRRRPMLRGLHIDADVDSA